MRPVVATLTLSVLAPVPDAGLRLSQLVFSVAAQLSVPLPELEIEMVLAAGLLPPCVAVNDSEVAFRPIVGVGAAVMSKVTATVWGELPDPGPTIVMIPLREPTGNPLGLTATFIDPRFEPATDEVPFSVSHVLFDEAVHINVPVPPLEMVKVCIAGVVPFCMAEKDIAVGFRRIVGEVTVGAGSS